MIERAYLVYPEEPKSVLNSKCDNDFEIDEETAESSSSGSQSINEYFSDGEE